MGNFCSDLADLFCKEDLTDFERDQLKRLKEYHTVVIVDDSPSMTRHWRATRNMIRRLIRVAIKFDRDGIDVHFLNTNKHVRNCRSVLRIFMLFWWIKLVGTTPLGERLQQHFRRYLDAFEAAMVHKPVNSSLPPNGGQSNHDVFYSVKPEKFKDGTSASHQPVDHAAIMKPVNFLILTDGKPDSQDDVKNAVLEAIDRLSELNAPGRHFGTQFVQVGDNIEATRFLDYLDNDVGKDNRSFRDIVDTVKYVPGVRLDLVKVLMGAIDKNIDARNQLVEHA